jgi:hypothetical protein
LIITRAARLRASDFGDHSVMPDSKVDPQSLPNPTTAEANQARKREFIPGWALLGIAAVIAAGVLFAIFR